MKKIYFLSSLFLLVFTWLFFALPTSAANNITIYFFHRDGCPHCANEIMLLDKIQKENSLIKINRYEVSNNEDNRNFLYSLAEKLSLNISGVPITIIGDKVVYGYDSEETTGQEILHLIDNCSVKQCFDIVQYAFGISDEPSNTNNSNNQVDQPSIKVVTSKTINVPFWGKVELKGLPLPLITILIAAVDGFNPCAMWVLLFLISLLLGFKERWKMWCLGIAFIFASGAMYFVFLAAWLNLTMFLKFIEPIKILIGLIAMGSGIYYLRDYWINRDGGCKVVNTEERKKIFTKMRAIVENKNFLLALLGIMFLAVAVNLVELVCSIGLPVVFSEIITMSKLPTWVYYLYLLLYIIVFMLDDILIFVIAMLTLRSVGISAKYTRWANLVGGIIIFILGILLIFKPEWLMFK